MKNELAPSGRLRVGLNYSNFLLVLGNVSGNGIILANPNNDFVASKLVARDLRRVCVGRISLSGRFAGYRNH